jgi:hypothetical protein
MASACRALGALSPAARLLTGSTFGVLGYSALREPGRGTEEAATFMAAIRKEIRLPITDEQAAVRSAGLAAGPGVPPAPESVPAARATNRGAADRGRTRAEVGWCR